MCQHLNMGENCILWPETNSGLADGGVYLPDVLGSFEVL